MNRSPYFQKQMDTNPEKYPNRHGMPWDEEEIQQLLIEIARKMTFEEISEKHERTLGGIRARLMVIVRNYYDEGKPIEKIIKYTGLDEKTIQDTISKHIAKKNKEEKPKKEKKEVIPIVNPQSTSPLQDTIGNDFSERLWRIECLLVKILDKLEKLS